MALMGRYRIFHLPGLSVVRNGEFRPACKGAIWKLRWPGVRKSCLDLTFPDLG
jgi:hypothetical protein